MKVVIGQINKKSMCLVCAIYTPRAADGFYLLCNAIYYNCIVSISEAKLIYATRQSSSHVQIRLDY